MVIASERGRASLTQYVYDALNRLIVAEQPNTWQVRYSYDAFGRRLTRTLCTWNGRWNESERSLAYYQGQKEIGMLREGHIDQLRVLGHGRGAELGAAIAFRTPYRANLCTHSRSSRQRVLLDRQHNRQRCRRVLLYCLW